MEDFTLEKMHEFLRRMVEEVYDSKLVTYEPYFASENPAKFNIKYEDLKSIVNFSDESVCNAPGMMRKKKRTAELGRMGIVFGGRYNTYYFMVQN